MDSLDQVEPQPLEEEGRLSGSSPSLGPLAPDDSDESSEEDSLAASHALSSSQLVSPHLLQRQQDAEPYIYRCFL